MRTRHILSVACLAAAGVVVMNQQPAGAQNPLDPQGQQQQQQQAGQQPSEQEVRQLLDVMGTREQTETGLNLILQQNAANAPPGFIDAFRQEMNIDALISELVPVYQRHLTQQEVQAMTEFFSSPVGQSFIEKQPRIGAESMQIVQRMSMQAAQRAMQRTGGGGMGGGGF